MMHALHKFLLFYLLTCLGLKALGSQIVHGKKAPERLMLYMASVQNHEGHVCGGFLINQDYVLTAAHCDRSNPTSVVLGTHNLKRVENATMRYAVKTCKYPSFDNERSGNDIMLLKLSMKARLDDKVRPIQLPKNEIQIKDKSKCRVAGWGYTRTGGKTIDVLQVADVSVVNLDVCKREWGYVPFNLPDGVICAGGYGTDKGFCKGDSGGPLVCSGTAVGVVSFNMRKNCNYPNVPNVYTNISKHLHWIKKVIKQNSC